MIMSGNTMIVLIAMLIDLYPKTVEGEAAGIRLGFLLSAVAALVGVFLALGLLRRHSE